MSDTGELTEKGNLSKEREKKGTFYKMGIGG